MLSGIHAITIRDENTGDEVLIHSTYSVFQLVDQLQTDITITVVEQHRTQRKGQEE